MRLEYGKKYKTRCGQVVGPLIDNKNMAYPFLGSPGTAWTSEGKYWADGTQSDHDIVEEVTEESATPNPYTRTLPTYPDGTSDIYCVLRGYNVTDPAIAHAVKKLLVPGRRSGGKSYTQDLEEARDSIQKVIDLDGSE